MIIVLPLLLALAQAPRFAPAEGAVQDPTGPSVPLADRHDHRFGPGPVHKVVLDGSSTREIARLRSRGAVVGEVDYGGFRLVLVDEVAFGGREQLRSSGLSIRDELDLVYFDGYVLDGTRPGETLAAMPPEELLGDPHDPGLDPLAGLYLVQFIGPPRDVWLDALRGPDLRIVQPLPMDAYVVEAGAEGVARLAAWSSRPEVQYVGTYQPGFRMTPGIRRAAREEAGRPLRVTVQLVAGAMGRAAFEDVRNLAIRIEGRDRVGPYVDVRAVLDPVYFQWLAGRPAVFGIEEYGRPERQDERQGQTVAGNVSGPGPTAPGYLAWLASRGFDSTQFGSFSVNVVDDATSLSGHPDLAGARIDFARNPTFQTGSQGGHGFLNANIVAGFDDATGSAFEDSAGYNYGLGIAPWAHVGSTAIFGTGPFQPNNYESNAYALGARISTNSWVFVDGASNPVPDYDSNAQFFDFLVRDVRASDAGNQEYTFVFAAGNYGAAANTVSSPGTAKNVITVGASENERPTGTDGCGIPNSGANDVRDVISFSSRGPVNGAGGDGRWKPEIVAPGTHVQAGVPQSNYDGSSVCNAYWPPGQTLYGWSSGTSHSTPAVAGGAALVRQHFLNQGSGPPSPAMTKAVLTNGATYLTGTGAGGNLPSTSQGMGRMNLDRAFDGVPRLLVDQTQVFGASGESFVLTGSVADVLEPFRVSLVWTDAPGPTTGGPWVNDLDLSVEVNGSTYLGNVFSGASSVSGGSADTRNNTESVFLPAGTSGSFTVTVDARTIAGDGVPGNGDATDQDFALVVYNASGTTAPTAQFIGSPTSGFLPLSVSFTDLSTGDVNTWSWDFGDGQTSTAQNPNHTYTVAGTYTVALVASGPGGTDTLTRTDYVDVNDPPPPGLADGSFEGQTPATVPTAPWTIAFGTGHVIDPDGVAADGAMPSDGLQWAEVAADDTNGALPPSNPGGATAPPVGGAGISQTFRYAAGEPFLQFEAAFLRNESPNDPVFNDWMSVDVTDGTTTFNLYYRDTFSPTPNTSVKYGYAMTAVDTVSADLSALFPGSSSATLFTLTVLVGNGDDDASPSRGYADGFRLGPIPPPVAEFSGTPLSGVLPLTVDFTDLSTGGPVATWSWDFGDAATSTEANPSHVYAASGVYTVALTVTGPGGSDTETKVGYVTVDEPPPVAEFSGAPLSGVLPLTVDFTDLSTGGPVATWSWDFGDTATSTEANPSHVYAASGVYTVALTVTGPGGSDTETKVGYVTVDEPPPVAEFSGTPLSGVLPLTVDFTDLSTGGPVATWSWDFGDTATSTEANPSHVYSSPGTYSVTLLVTGPGGTDSETKVGYVHVEDRRKLTYVGSPTLVPVDLQVSLMIPMVEALAGLRAPR